MIAVKNHQDCCAAETAEHLCYDIARNLCPGHAAAKCYADGYCRIEVSTGHCAEAECRYHNCHTPADKDVNGARTLHSRLVQVNVAAYAVAQDNKEHRSDKLC